MKWLAEHAKADAIGIFKRVHAKGSVVMCPICSPKTCPVCSGRCPCGVCHGKGEFHGSFQNKCGCRFGKDSATGTMLCRHSCTRCQGKGTVDGLSLHLEQQENA